MYSYEIYYIEATIATIVILAMIVFSAARNVDTQMHKRYLASCIVLESLYLIVDVFWTILENGSPSEILHSNILLYTLMCLMGYSMLQYSLSLQEQNELLRGRIQFLMYLPMMFNFILIFTTPFTHIYFYIGADGRIAEGNSYVVMIALAMIYPCAASISSLITALPVKNYADRMLHITHCVAFLPTIAGGVLQAIFPHIPIVCFGITLTMLCLYMSSINSYISLDPLTQINNRNQFKKHLANKLRDNGDLALIIMDLDRFKTINDTYGHLEGDSALVRTAQALKVTCGNNRSKFFISRYGGDEFVVIISGTYDDATRTCALIQKNLNQLNDEANVEYTLTLSFGIASKGPDTSTIPSLLAVADKRLYKQKQIKHNTYQRDSLL